MTTRSLQSLLTEKALAEAELQQFVMVVNTQLGGDWTAERAQQYSDIACRIVFAAFDIACHPDWQPVVFLEHAQGNDLQQAGWMN